MLMTFLHDDISSAVSKDSFNKHNDPIISWNMNMLLQFEEYFYFDANWIN